MIDKLSQLKVLKTELERRRWESERRPNESSQTKLAEMQEHVRQIHKQQTTGMSSQFSGLLKLPQLEITSFTGYTRIY